MNSKTIQKYQDRNLSWLKAKAQEYFNEFIRYRDTDENGYGRCISSGKTIKVPSANSHAGHFFSTKYQRLRYDERNVNLQSRSENYFNHGHGTAYRIYLVHKIGEDEVKELEQISLDKSAFKWGRFELIEIIETYKTKSKELRKQKMF